MRSAVTMISTAVTMISNAVILSSWCLWIWVLVQATVCLLSSDSSPRLQLDSSTWQLLRDACYQNQDHCPDSEHQDYWILKVNFIDLCMWTNCFINININISINIVKGWKGSVVLFDEIDRSECGSRGGSQPNLWHIVFPVNIFWRTANVLAVYCRYCKYIRHTEYRVNTSTHAPTNKLVNQTLDMPSGQRQYM